MKANSFLFFILSIIFLFLACTNKEKAIPRENNSDYLYLIDDISEANIFASEQYQTLVQSFCFSRSDVDSINYPSYYGGAYIDENDKLVVLLSDTSIGYKRNIEKVLGSKNFILKKCRFSYIYLKQVINTINQFYQEDVQFSSIIQNISYIRFQEDKNCIIIGLLEHSEERINEFRKNIVDSPAIKFEYAPDLNSVESKFQLHPGSYVRNSKSKYQDKSSSSASLGYRAKMSDGSEGFVVSGHFLWEGGALYYPITDDGPFEFIGSCVRSQTSGNVDAAFCVIETDICDLLQIPDPIMRLDPVVFVSVGQAVKMYGYKRSSVGKITGVDISAAFKNETRIGSMFTADYSSEPGDSGSAVYTPVPRNGIALVGIHQGRSTYNEAYIVQARYINKAFGISCY